MTTRTVKQAGGGDFTTIGAAVAASANGDIVLVYDGTYSESVILPLTNFFVRAAPGQHPVMDGLSGALPYAFSWSIEPNATVEGLEIHSYDGLGVMQSGGVGGVIDRCYIHDCNAPAMTGGYGIGGDHAELKNCIILRTRGGWDGTGSAASSWNNLIVPQAGYNGIVHAGDSNGQHLFNTIILDSGSGIGIDTGAGTAKGNIVINLSAGGTGIRAGVCDYNIARGFTANYAGGGPGANDLTSDPLFVGAPDYSLQPGSPARDSCIDLGIYLDVLGVVRPKGAAFDRGAYEYTPPVVVRCYQIDGVDVVAYEVNPAKCEQENGVDV